MFGISKLVGGLLHPLAWVALLLVLGLWLLRRRRVAAAGRLVAGSLALLLFLGWEWPPARLLAALESRHPPLHRIPDGMAGMVVLGGALERGSLAAATGQVPLNDAAERMTEALALARTHPDWTVVFSGGDGHLFPGGWTEAQMARVFWQQQGLPAERLLLEDRSRNTAENALFSARLPGVDLKAHWLLVTSAAHMTRALAAFGQAGWNVTPYPVDYRGDPSVRWGDYSFGRGTRLWTTLTHEAAGLVALRLQMARR